MRIPSGFAHTWFPDTPPQIHIRANEAILHEEVQLRQLRRDVR
jgi:hypothetical protein